MEHRWGERMSVYVPVRLDARPKALAPGCIRNASLSGAYIQTSVRLAPGMIVAVELEGALRAPERPTVHAWLVRQDSHGLAVEWCEFAPEVIRAVVARVRAQDAGSLPFPAPAPSRFAPRHGRPPEGMAMLNPPSNCRPPTSGAPR
jgi:hypothetical protein